MQILLQAQQPQLRFFKQVFFFQVRLFHRRGKICFPVIDQPFYEMRVGFFPLQFHGEFSRFRGNAGTWGREVEFCHQILGRPVVFTFCFKGFFSNKDLITKKHCSASKAATGKAREIRRGERLLIVPSISIYKIDHRETLYVTS